MTDMKKLETRQELLVITMEECGELIQACSKALRRGELYEHSDSETELKKEIGDVQTMINLLVEYDVVSWTEIEQREDRKREKLKVPFHFGIFFCLSPLGSCYPPSKNKNEKQIPN